MSQLILSSNSLSFKGEIEISKSKSEWNRILIMQALAETEIDNIPESAAHDIQTLASLLNTQTSELDCGPAGTCFRFLTAYLTTRDGEFTLTGSERMKKRPVSPLVNALKTIGAEISYVEEDGFPPLKIKGKTLRGRKIEIDGSISSQFITALLLIAPYLENGLEICILNKLLSKPYVEMTLALMQKAGINSSFIGDTIKVEPGKYNIKQLKAEADWSSLSYWYSIAALSNSFDVYFPGYFEDSLQADSRLIEIYKRFGILTAFEKDGLRITKLNAELPLYFEFDFTNCPDIAQTVAATCVGLQIECRLTGLDNLNLKESDRIMVMAETLSQFECEIVADKNSLTISNYKGSFDKTLEFDTYHDHRVAMSLAPLVLKSKQLSINSPEVVNKSYPQFWDDLSKMGINTQLISS